MFLVIILKAPTSKMSLSKIFRAIKKLCRNRKIGHSDKVLK